MCWVLDRLRVLLHQLNNTCTQCQVQLDDQAIANTHGVYCRELGHSYYHVWSLDLGLLDQVRPQTSHDGGSGNWDNWSRNHGVLKVCDYNNRPTCLRILLRNASHLDAPSDGRNSTRRMGGFVRWLLLSLLCVRSLSCVLYGCLPAARI
jgi:hypothetical protein